MSKRKSEEECPEASSKKSKRSEMEMTDCAELPEWRQELGMWEMMGYDEELLWGWFPFVKEDFCYSEEEEEEEEDLWEVSVGFDDNLWQIK